jgi:hypothetical protein
MWVGEMTPEDVLQIYIKLSQYEGNKSISIWFILFLLFCSYIFGKFIKRLMKKKHK